MSSYPDWSTVVGIEQNVQSLKNSQAIVLQLETLLTLLSQWEQSGELPDNALGILQIPVAVGNETLKAELPLRCVPKDGLPAMQVVVGLMLDLWSQRGETAAKALRASVNQLCGIMGIDGQPETNVDSSAVLAEAGTAENRSTQI